MYYQGRHDIDVPKEIRDSLQQLDKRAERLSVVDAARDVVIKYGGPPSRATIAESLERSAQERTKEQGPVAVPGKAIPDRDNTPQDLASVAASSLKMVEPKIEKEWAQALRNGGDKTVNARYQANLQGLNDFRKELNQRHPDWEAQLPPAVNVQEVSERLTEQVREQRQGPELSR